MNRTTTVVVALIAAAGLSTMTYAIAAQRALAWTGFGGCGGGFGFGCGGCGGGICGGGFFDGCGGGICGFFGEARLTCSITDNVDNAIIYTPPIPQSFCGLV
jgi:hypothetical protein